MKQNKQHYIDRLSFEGKLDDVIGELQKLKETHTGYDSLEITEDSCYEGGYTYDLVGNKMETDEEAKERIEREEGYAKQNLEYKRRQYEALKEIFEPGPCEPLKESIKTPL